MARKLLILFAAYFISLFALIAHSCVPDKKRICDIEFGGKTPSYYQSIKDSVALNAPQDTATITDTTGLYVAGPDPYQKTCCAPFNNPLVSSCYAFKKGLLWQNDLVPWTFNLSLDRQIAIGNDTVAAGVNILEVPGFQNQTHFVRNDKNHTHSREFTLAFPKTLLSYMNVDTNIYIATFSCYTTDSLHFTKTLPVRFRK